MEKLKGKYKLSPVIFVEYAIGDGVAVMTCNYAKPLQQIYFKAKKDGKNVSWDYRRNAMIEKFDCSPQEFKEKLDKDFLTGMEESKKAETYIGGTKK